MATKTQPLVNKEIKADEKIEFEKKEAVAEISSDANEEIAYVLKQIGFEGELFELNVPKTWKESIYMDIDTSSIYYSKGIIEKVENPKQDTSQLYIRYEKNTDNITLNELKQRVVREVDISETINLDGIDTVYREGKVVMPSEEYIPIENSFENGIAFIHKGYIINITGYSVGDSSRKDAVRLTKIIKSIKLGD